MTANQLIWKTVCGFDRITADEYNNIGRTCSIDGSKRVWQIMARHVNGYVVQHINSGMCRIVAMDRMTELY